MRPVALSGERVSTAAGGFNTTFQRHVAAYLLCEPLLGPGRVLDLGCGVGHSAHVLAPRESVGVDSDPAALAQQTRETHLADMRALPFADGTFASVLAVQSLEHVPDPERVLAEVTRVMEPGGVAVFVTPNRLTFGRADEIIDPYHYIEYDAQELETLMAEAFADVVVHGMFGSPRVQAILEKERRSLERVLAADVLRLRRVLPRRVRQRLYDRALALARLYRPLPEASAVSAQDYFLRRHDLEDALDLIAVCRVPHTPAARGSPS